MLRRLKWREHVRPILITAGATRNPVDAMRFISARSSGRTGVRLAESLESTGNIHLLGSPEALLRSPNGIETEAYSSTDDLLVRMRTWVRKHPHGIVVHASAVGDYMASPSAPETHDKIESGQAELILRLVPTPKILDEIHSWSNDVDIISFKAAAPGVVGEQLESIAHKQLIRTNSVVVFANTIGDLDASVALVGPDQTDWFDNRISGLEELTKRIVTMAT